MDYTSSIPMASYDLQQTEDSAARTHKVRVMTETWANLTIPQHLLSP